jgi:hypothetical protein
MRTNADMTALWQWALAALLALMLWGLYEDSLLIVVFGSAAAFLCLLKRSRYNQLRLMEKRWRVR